MGSTEILLTVLSVCTGLVAISNFFSGRKKDNKNEGAQEATLRSDLLYIKELLIDVRTETKEINKLLDVHSQKLAKFEEQLQSGFKRIKRLEEQFDHMKGE